MPADLTLINLNMLFIRYGEDVERELHTPLGCLYLAKALQDSGLNVDFRDYQTCDAADPFDVEAFIEFIESPAPVIGLSCMANLLPFSIIAAKAIKDLYPDRVVVLGGVGPKGVEDQILQRFPWIDVIARGEGERTGPELLKAIEADDLTAVTGISYRHGGRVVHNPDRPRISDLDSIPLPAYEMIDLDLYTGYGMMTSRGCPYSCTFCSVAPVWNHETFSRSPANIVTEMKTLHEMAGVDMFLFQDEFFVSGKKHVMAFCDELRKSDLDIEWKAFGRVNLTDVEMMQAMAASGCVELRFGIESGSDRMLTRMKKGFTAAEVLALVPAAVEIFPRVDTFYVWGFPDETDDDFNQTLFQMVSFRTMGARILPSLLSLLPQTEIYESVKDKANLEFCPFLLPEFVFTGHEIIKGSEVEIPVKYRQYFDLITSHPDIFPGFYHFDPENNVMPKLELLRQFGFYPQPDAAQEQAPAASQLSSRR